MHLEIIFAKYTLSPSYDEVIQFCKKIREYLMSGKLSSNNSSLLKVALVLENTLEKINSPDVIMLILFLHFENKDSLLLRNSNWYALKVTRDSEFTVQDVKFFASFCRQAYASQKYPDILALENLIKVYEKELGPEILFYMAMAYANKFLAFYKTYGNPEKIYRCTADSEERSSAQNTRTTFLNYLLKAARLGYKEAMHIITRESKKEKFILSTSFTAFPDDLGKENSFCLTFEQAGCLKEAARELERGQDFTLKIAAGPQKLFSVTSTPTLFPPRIVKPDNHLYQKKILSALPEILSIEEGISNPFYLHISNGKSAANLAIRLNREIYGSDVGPIKYNTLQAMITVPPESKNQFIEWCSKLEQEDSIKCEVKIPRPGLIEEVD